MGITEFLCWKLLASGVLEDNTKELDASLEEAVSSLIWVTPYMKSKVPELKSISKKLTKYGRNHTKAATKSKNCLVCPDLRQRLEFRTGSENLTLRALEEIMKKYNVPKEQKNKFESYLIDTSVEDWSKHEMSRENIAPTKECETKKSHASRIKSFIGNKIPSFNLLKRSDNTHDTKSNDNGSKTDILQIVPECNNLQTPVNNNNSVITESTRKYPSPAESFQDFENVNNLPNSFCPGKCSFTENYFTAETRVILNGNDIFGTNNTLSSDGRFNRNISSPTKPDVDYLNETVQLPAVPDDLPPKYDEISCDKSCSGSSIGNFYSPPHFLPSPAPSCPCPSDDLYFEANEYFCEDTNFAESEQLNNVVSDANTPK
ncbi:hypothetical protein JTE90_004593 [Oedothorax gibbosus]|uniref:IST1 homolog n=1 Tax=Oedothorax gibbosus TaxID=931172 RepID=A0AAV6UMF7_9ARAC|nr:hypothetical protein JTE90_004593 [Oedothorax gibbosus]